VIADTLSEISLTESPLAGRSDPTPVDTSCSDHELMLAVRDGDLPKLGDLYERHHRPLYGFFVHLTGDRIASEDLVQLVFFRILKYRRTYRDEGKFSAWIYHIARRIAADHGRELSRTPSVRGDTGDLDPTDLLADEGPDPAERMTRDDDLAILRRSVASLPHEHREVLVMSRFQHIPHKDIATLLNTSTGAVKARVHRAMKLLRERVEHARRASAN
jgi:RNA polymerase sigma factor (sigma-70 family)